MSTPGALISRLSSAGLGYFLNAITVPGSPEPAPFRDLADNWQREKIGPKVPALEHLAGLRPDYRGPLRFMDILARGHSKTSEEAWIAVWLCLAARRPIHGYVLAADREQGRLVVQAAEDLLRLNDWLAEHVTVQKDKISGRGGDVTVLPFNAATGMGLRGNFYIFDEIAHWGRQKEWDAVTSGLHKVRPTVVCVLSNAGSIGTWQHRAFEDARDNPAYWTLFYRKGTLASWLDPDSIKADRRVMIPSEAARLLDNEWIDPAAEYDYLRRPEIEACEAAGAAMGLQYRLRRQVGVGNYVASIDYGPRRDRTALAVMHAAPGGSVVVDRLDVWQGSPDAPVQIEDVEKWVEDVQQGFAPVAWVIDPYQMEATIQGMQKKGLPVEAFKTRAGQGNFELAQLLRALVVDARLVWYPGAGSLGRETLIDELAALRVKKMPYGFRFDHENQKHDDRAVALAMGAQKALTKPAPSRGIALAPTRRESEAADREGERGQGDRLAYQTLVARPRV